MKEDTHCAQNAVDAAFTAYLDLLEDLQQRATPEQLNSVSESRQAYANTLKQLRADVDALVVLTIAQEEAS